MNRRSTSASITPMKTLIRHGKFPPLRSYGCKPISRYGQTPPALCKTHQTEVHNYIRLCVLFGYCWCKTPRASSQFFHHINRMEQGTLDLFDRAQCACSVGLSSEWTITRSNNHRASVPSKKIIHWANVCFVAHETATMQTHQQWRSQR